MQNFVRCFVIASVCLITSCTIPVQTGPIVDMTPEQVQKSTDIGLLRSMQTTLQSALADKTEMDYPRDFELLHLIDKRLAKLLQARIERQLDLKRISVEQNADRVVPLPKLEKLTAMVKADESISDDQTSHVLSPIKEEKGKTQKLIDTYINESKKDKIGSKRRARVYQNLFELSGNSHWEEVRDKQMEIILNAIRKSEEKGSFSTKLESRVDFVRSIYRDPSLAVADEMFSVYANIYARRYFYKLDRDEPEAAHKVIQDLGNKPDFQSINAKLEPQKSIMLQEFTGKLDASLNNQLPLANSYTLFIQLMDISHMLGADFDGDAKAKLLAQKLYAEFELLKAQKNQAAALGILYAVYDIFPNHPNLISEFSQLESEIYKASVPTLNVHTLRSHNSERDYGRFIARYLRQHLRSAIPMDIKVISPTDEEAATTKTNMDLRGNILQAKVSQSRKATRKTLTVNVGQSTIPNPDFIAWLELPAKDREDIEKPKETLTIEREENITIGSQLHQKVGVFSASFRLSNASGEVIYPDSITLQKEYQDDSNAVFEFGKVVIPEKTATLPTDQDILDEIAKEMANKMGENLAAELADRENVYISQADQAAENNNCQEEIDHTAKALAMLRAKGKDTDLISKRLRQRSVHCLSSLSTKIY